MDPFVQTALLAHTSGDMCGAHRRYASATVHPIIIMHSCSGVGQPLESGADTRYHVETDRALRLARAKPWFRSLASLASWLATTLLSAR
jgi:hypothetical protein